MKPLRPALTALALGLLAAGAPAQTVWRCDDAGRVLYQGEPCTNGRVIEPAPGPTTGAAAEAERTAARERALAQSLAAERRQRESGPVALAAGILNPPNGLSPSQKPKPRTKPQTKRPQAAGAEADTWRAVAPSSRRKPG